MSQPAFDFDLVVLGGGSGGLAGAFRAAGHGARVALLEPGELGGTCVNVGCVPKKAMWLAAGLAGDVAVAAQLGFDVPDTPALDWPTLVAARQRYIHGIHDSYRRRLDEAGIVLVPSRGQLVDAHTVACEDGNRLRGRHLLLATGSRPRRLDVPGAGLAGVSDDFFAFHAPPGHVALVGGGYIAVELAGVLQALGCRVDVLARGERLLGQSDAELVERLQEDYRQQGIGLHLGRELAAIEGGPGALRLRDHAGEVSGTYAHVILAVGREPNTSGIGLERAGVELDRKGHVVVDAFQRSSVPHIAAVGDVTGRAMLTPVAISAARRAMDRVFGGRDDARLDYDDVPTVVFSHPPLAAVGLTEAQARERHGDAAVHVYRSLFRPMRQALVDRPRHSLFKLVCVGDERRVAGIHLLGEGADEILQGFAVALKRGITLDDLHDTVAIHPTSAEEVVLMR
ncbi:glutathione-disulfide reductase [Luteimonas wenzhouensis]|uniref:Glutathione-disulfide reductase n=1 Tax=Luteimonas wenzhouensis TaxID=2599615 RepID=A0A5C5U543_9GAMM|nr:glutathione-disulfide reductase [Luteimonas wenzhouensis]TWT20575.1 glutathione-disulfide reductase [Luteimonas wenzhouensis]